MAKKNKKEDEEVEAVKEVEEVKDDKKRNLASWALLKNCLPALVGAKCRFNLRSDVVCSEAEFDSTIKKYLNGESA